MKRHPNIARIVLATGMGLACLAAAPAHGQTAAAPSPHRTLGTVNFPVTCSPAAQADFNHAMLLQHSFWYQMAGESFRQVRQQDPGCTMAYWGEALTLLTNPYSPPSPQNLRQGKALLEEAQRIGTRSPREAAYIEALAVLFAGDNPPGHRARLTAYRDAMGRLHERFPDDKEAMIHYALLLGVASSPNDRSYADPLRGAAMLERELVLQPEHPGIVHYLIHLYDYPALASRGVRAADRYGTLAADAPHALHMPSHIYTRVGRWEDSVESNRRAAELALRNREPDDTLHAYDYMVYAYLQTGRDRAAREAMERAISARFEGPTRNAYAFAMAAIPARFALERGDWADAATLTPRAEPNFAYTEALTHFARAIGLSRSGRPMEATPDIEALARIAQALQARDPYWSEQVAIQREAAMGVQQFAAGQREDGLATLRGAAEREGRTDKHVVTPGPLAPARELYAEALMEAGEPARALTEFVAVQVTEPRRFRAILGAARAAEAAGQPDEARRHYAALVDVAGQADGRRAELIAARAYLAR
ncbi:tetratricopeptide repeat protein [Roseococcus sp. YIM B11640]|uniref:tetratricopeptide repeat protein n=1 Tax=Roseococcus sp. YIM B11640 TaxID=3133973 RepID=UPI003C7EB809